MGKELSEMTLAELWELFPIFLVQHDDKWKNYYKEIEDLIMDLLPDYPVERISHIGSTAIQGIWAKNIVDVMVEISEKPTWKNWHMLWSGMVLSECPLKQTGFHSIKGIPKKALRIRFITFISDTSEIMMNCISATI